MPRKPEPPQPLPGELKVRVGLYLSPADRDALDAIVDELPGVSSRNGAASYLIDLYKARKAVRSKAGRKGAVPLYEDGDLVV